MSLFHRDTIEHRSRRNVPLPVDVDWSARAYPTFVAIAEGYEPRSVALLARRDQISHENATFMRLKHQRLGGLVLGYHGTRTPSAHRIGEQGFAETINEEGRAGVSAWDSVVGHQALRFAARRAMEAGDPDMGRVIAVRMTDPHEDSWNGRLEWLAQPQNTEVLGIYSPEEFARHLAELEARRPAMQVPRGTPQLRV